MIMTPTQATANAAIVLISRLVQRHGLTVEEAVTAVAQRRKGEDGPHTDLVAAEATLILEQISAPFRSMLQAFQPLMTAAAAAMNQILRAVPPVTHSTQHLAEAMTNKAARDRPGWASTYGPPPGRRRRTPNRTPVPKGHQW